MKTTFSPIPPLASVEDAKEKNFLVVQAWRQAQERAGLSPLRSGGRSSSNTGSPHQSLTGPGGLGVKGAESELWWPTPVGQTGARPRAMQ